MREEVAKATLCQPRLTLAPLVHSDQYSITVSSRTKHTPSTPAPPTIATATTSTPFYVYIYIYVRVYISISFPSSVSTLQLSPSRPLLHSFSLASFLHYPPALFLFVSPLSPRPTLSLSLSLLFAIRITLSLPGACDSLSFSLRPPLIDSVHASLSLSLSPAKLAVSGWWWALGAVIAKIIASFSVGHPRKQSRARRHDETRLIRDLFWIGDG